MNSLVLFSILALGALAHGDDRPLSVTCRGEDRCSLQQISARDLAGRKDLSSSCLGLFVRLNSGIGGPFQRWSLPKQLKTVTPRWAAGARVVSFDGVPGETVSNEDDIYCPVDFVNYDLLLDLRAKVEPMCGNPNALGLHDILTLQGVKYSVERLYVNRAGYVYAVLRSWADNRSYIKPLNAYF